jgi:hypothetical protein
VSLAWPVPGATEQALRANVVLRHPTTGFHGGAVLVSATTQSMQPPCA